MKRYDSYKDSGVKWLGEIPSHWEVVKNKYLFVEKDERNIDGSYQLLSFSKSKGIIPFDENSDKESSSDNLRKYKVLHKGQLLENRLQAWNGMFLDSKIEGCVSPDYSVFDLLNKNYIIRYFSYLFRTNLYIEQWANASRGIGSGFNRLYTPQFGNIFSICPPTKEQYTIVTYLDAATSKIDAAIAQQQKMIDLLNERKQIIINNAVTKGLDPNVKMKPSGIDWIGDIPEHWEIRKLKTIVDKVGSGVTPRGGGSVYVDEGIMLLRSQNVYFEGFKLNDVAFITEAMDKEMGNTRVKEGDVLINITGGSIGRCHFVPKGFPRANVNQHVCIVRPRNFSSKYLYYLLRSNFCQLQVELQQTGGNREGLTSAALKNFVLSIPPENEQKKIIDYLDEKDKGLQYSIEICQKQISLLQERKQIVINDVVTGKVKVV